MRVQAIIIVIAGLLLIEAQTSVQAQMPEYEPSYERPKGEELVMVYLGAYSCAPCRTPEMKQALERAKVLLSQRAEEQGKGFAAVGAALDWEVEKGLEFLQASGRFDELIVGRNWMNTAAVEHMWQNEAVDPSIPMIVVFERKAQSGGGGITVGPPNHVLSKLGVDGIENWVDAGVPLDG